MASPSTGEAESATTSQLAPLSGTTETVIPRSFVSRTMTLQNLGAGKVLVHPLYVRVECSGGDWSAESADLALVGAGETDLDALDDLRAQVLELYESLSEMRDELGPHLVDQLHFLDRLAGLK